MYAPVFLTVSQFHFFDNNVLDFGFLRDCINDLDLLGDVIFVVVLLSGLVLSVLKRGDLRDGRAFCGTCL